MARNYEVKNEVYVIALTQLIERLGGVKTDRPSYPYALTTKAGKLQLGVSPNMSEPGAAVFAYFEEVEKAKEVIGFGLNPFTGKWNTHFFGTPVVEAVETLRHKLTAVVVPTSPVL